MLAILLGVAASAGTGSVRAAPTAADKATAKDLMKEGKELRAKGDHAGAAKKFAGAYAAFPSPITGLALAQEQIEVGLLVEARDVLASIGQMAPTPLESEDGKKARVDAGILLGELVPRIPVLEVAVGGAPAGAAVTLTIDGAAVALAAAEQGVRLDPGKHKVIAQWAGHEAQTAEVELVEKDRKKVTLTFPEGAVASDPKVEPTKPAGAAPSASSPAKSDGGPSGQRIAGIVAGGVGLAVLGVGGFLALSAKSRYDDAKTSHCPSGACDAEGKRLTDDAISRAGTATLFVGIGAAVAVTGVVLFVVAPSGEAQKTGVTSLGVGLGTLTLSGRF